MARTISRFTPSLLAHGDLEQLYVDRNHVLDRVAERIDRAARSGSRDHTLIVGPRGAGKTHLTSLAYYRTKARLDDIGVQVAWLDEDPWLVLSYDDLLGQILDRLEPGDHSTSRPNLEHYLIEQSTAHGPIVVFVENFDQILDQIGGLGQQKLRHLLQSTPAVLLVATTTNLSQHLKAQDAPFYGFMTVEQLEPFTRRQAGAMLTLIADYQGDDDLGEYIAGAGQNRLRVIEHIAGGQPRMWATLSTALDVQALDDLVDHLLNTFDDLTPYYQEQLARLSGHQRRVVAALAAFDRPVNTVELADKLEIDQRSLSKTISDLRDRGWVKPSESRFISILDGRSTYYELAEPLARIAFQIKASRGEPLRVVLDFLKGWFDADTLEDASAESDGAIRYLELARSEITSDGTLAVAHRLSRLPASRMPIMEVLVAVDRALEALEDHDPSPFFALASPLRGAVEARLNEVESPAAVTELRLEIHRKALAEAGNVPDETTPAWAARALSMSLANPESAQFLANSARWLGTNWQFEEAGAFIDRLAETLGHDHPDTLSTRNNLATSYWTAGRNNEAITLQESVLADRERTLGPDHPHTLTTRKLLAKWKAESSD